MSEPFMEIVHDTWNYGQPKLRSVGKITLPNTLGVLPFSGARNPITVSDTSQSLGVWVCSCIPATMYDSPNESRSGFAHQSPLRPKFDTPNIVMRVGEVLLDDDSFKFYSELGAHRPLV